MRSHVRTLLWKNWLLKKRHRKALALEILLPVIFIILMNGTKSMSPTVYVPPGWSDATPNPGNKTAGSSYTLTNSSGGFGAEDLEMKIGWKGAKEPRYLVRETTMSGLLLYLDMASPNAIPSHCRDNVTPYKIAIAPDTTFTRKYFLKTMKVWYPQVAISKSNHALTSQVKVPAFGGSVVFFKDEDELELYVTGENYGKTVDTPKIYGAVIFDKYPDEQAIGQATSIEYSLRFNATGQSGSNGDVPRTIGDPSFESPFQGMINTDPYSRYAVLGFMTLQTAITRFVNCMPVWDATTKSTTGACKHQMAVAKADAALDSKLFQRIGNDSFVQMALPFAFNDLSTAAIEHASISSTDKEKLLAPLRIAPQPYYDSTVAAFLVDAFLSSPFYNSVKSVFALVFVLAYLYAVSRILVAFIQEKETRSREYMKILGVRESSIILSWYITYFMIFLVSTFLQASVLTGGLFDNSSFGIVFFFFFFFSTSVLAFGFLVSTLFSRARTGAFAGMVLFFFMYFVSSAFEKVIPKEYGIAEKWYFPLSPSYWKRKYSAKINNTGVTDETVIDIDPSVEPVGQDLLEQEQTGEARIIKNIKKEFVVPGGVKKAVRGVSLAMYKDQITCLLDHNGAGKTTLISMLTGVIAPTEGDAYFRGMSFSRDMAHIRQSLGLCFQYDVLYAEMTVEEHLIFYARIKGYTKASMNEVVSTKIKEVGLTEKRKVFSAALSGGMKRKLSVAICLLGDSLLVFLDEPTSGMDPYSRRSTWEILLNNRQNRVMEGQLRCCGSSLFLKNRYGAGYNFTLVKREKCDEKQLIGFITTRVPRAKVLSNVGAEIAFQLPLDCSSEFPLLFEALDDQLETLGVLSYGISVTTMEEVFIKVAEADDEDNQHTLKKDAGSPDAVSTGPSSPSIANLTGMTMFFVHLHALLFKRFRVAKRDRRVLVFSTLLPVLLLGAGRGLLKSSTVTKADPKIPLYTEGFRFDTNNVVP
ncbi:hypothetical protein Poli38472_007886 [Pythium oligandrum]|uniref:ABC transporter domain-containing protein n=1 Tax=Pythium oligandrum TaxID=41045 RepID=A0A8K1CRE7_PYTOL|nr:hypothetical protein Poli38472_007886 [Pythium oligandrum]|eukprot:TMW68214.1 hypothetical protein Poli38472_007886 [Pythium oligandrum]